MCSSDLTLVRTRVDEVSVLGRNTQGVRLIRMADNERLVGLVKVVETNGVDSEGHDSDGEDAVDARADAEDDEAPTDG